MNNATQTPNVTVRPEEVAAAVVEFPNDYWYHLDTDMVSCKVKGFGVFQVSGEPAACVWVKGETSWCSFDIVDDTLREHLQPSQDL